MRLSNIGLRVNGEKTKHLMVARRSPNIDHITVNVYSFKKVEVFKYLSIIINSNRAGIKKSTIE